MSESQEAVERQRQIRILLSIAAYSYEYDNHSIVTDAEFDWLANEVIPTIETGNDKMDKFFQKTFSPDTGMWVHYHPEFDKLEKLYHSLVDRGLVNGK